MLLYVIRHGDPTYNPDALTPLGMRQAEAVGRRLSVHGIDEVYSSPMNRAKQTAQPTCEMLKKEMHIEDWTSEEHAFNDFSCVRDGKLRWCFRGEKALLRSNPEYYGDKWYDNPLYAGSHAKEGFERIASCSDEFLSRQGYIREGGIYHCTQENHKKIAVFCHWGFGSAWFAHLLNLNPAQFHSSMNISTSGITVFHFDGTPGQDTVPEMLMLSDLSHLYAEHLPLRYNAYMDI